ncbi:MAG: transglutaminase family protein [Candidatus Binatia bacterium]
MSGSAAKLNGVSHRKRLSFREVLSLSDEELARVDPIEMNLLVAKGIPRLADLNIPHYQRQADAWAEDIRRRLPALEREFHKTPEDWKNCIRFFRLSIVAWYLDVIVGIAYREDQAHLKRIRYTDPSDLFLNGVMDNLRGTCGNMAALYMAVCWRLGWPVFLATVRSHNICRYEDDEVCYNIDASNIGRGGFSSPSDEFYMTEYNLSRKAIDCGSDLRALSPRETLGIVIGLRARHLENIGLMAEPESDYLLARYLFPQSRVLYDGQMQNSVQYSMDLFEPHEKGHPVELASWLQEVVRMAPWKRKQNSSPKDQEITNASDLDLCFTEMFPGKRNGSA